MYKNEGKAIEIILKGEINVAKLPKEVFDSFISTLEEVISSSVEEERKI